MSKEYDKISEINYQSQSHRHAQSKPDFRRFPSESLLIRKQQTKKFYNLGPGDPTHTSTACDQGVTCHYCQISFQS